jgi:capsular polysaccharide biosynthesis protein
MLNLAIGGILSLMLGVMLVFFLEYTDNTIKNTEDVERILNLPNYQWSYSSQSFRIAWF